MTEHTVPMSTHGQCSARANNQDHCWHSSSPPINNGQVVSFPNLCCFCAPSYMHIIAYLPHTVSMTDLVAVQIAHGPLVEVRQMDKPPTIAIPNGPVPTQHNNQPQSALHRRRK
jgi:hypothetical protein